MSSATTVNTADTTGSGAAVPIMLTELRLPTIKRLWADLAAQSNREGWPAERLLHTLLGHGWPSARHAAWRAPEPTADCRRARAWQSSTSLRYRPYPRPT